MTKATVFEPVEVRVAPTVAVTWDGRSGTAPADVSRAMGEGFGALQAFVAEHALVPAGAPRAIYHRYGPTGAEFTLAMPIARGPGDGPQRGSVRVEELGGGRALRFTHTGPYERLRGTYDAIGEWLRSEGMLRSDADWAKFMPMWEEYPTDPMTTPAEELLTHIYLPLR